MSRHWSFKTLSGPTGGYYTATYENAEAKKTATFKIPDVGVYHGKPDKPLGKTAADKIAKKLKILLNQNT
jgi:hypothetical protein